MVRLGWRSGCILHRGDPRGEVGCLDAGNEEARRGNLQPRQENLDESASGYPVHAKGDDQTDQQVTKGSEDSAGKG